MMKQEKHILPTFYHEEQNVTYSLIWFNFSRIILDFNPTARFKHKMVDKQDKSPVGFWGQFFVAKSISFTKNGWLRSKPKYEFNYNPESPPPLRIVDELLCIGFKRNADPNATKTNYNEHK